MNAPHRIRCAPWMLVLALATLSACGSAPPAGNQDAGSDGGDVADDGGFDGGDEPDAGDVLDGGDEPDGGDAPDGGDSGGEDGGGEDGGGEVSDGGGWPPHCPPPEPYDYSCTMGDESTCPAGLCVFGLCLAPVVDQDRWDTCGNGVCDACETAEKCPADCLESLPMTGEREYDNDTTITVWLHGFSNKSGRMEDMVYGEARSCGTLANILQYGPDRPCGNTAETLTAPNQAIAVEYYGGVPADWLTPEDIEEIEFYPYDDGPHALTRYALVVGKFIRHRLELTGATHVNIACHSMGCLIARYVIENNVENLSAERRFVRWVSSAGVIAGARLARLYDNPTVQSTAPLLGLELSDFVLMNPDWVRDVAAWWDHRLHEGNNPYFGGMLIHHAGATDPRISQALNVQLLDLNNPDDEPNDGIMYTFDQFFHRQSEEASLHTPSGEVLQATRNFVYVDHMGLPRTDAFHLLASAALFHRRKVIVTLEEITLLNDREFRVPDRWREGGSSPAEVSVEVEVRYNPYVQETFGRNVLLHDEKIHHRSADLFTMAEGQTKQPKQVLYSGPIFDAMTSMHLVANVREVDWYPRFDVREILPPLRPEDGSDRLVHFSGQIPLENHTFTRESDYAKVTFGVKVVDLY